MIERLKKNFINISALKFAIIIAFLNLVLFHAPLFKFCLENLDMAKFGSKLMIACMVLIIPIANALVIYILCRISRVLAKVLCVFFFIVNAIAMYFMKTFNIMLNETMIGNVLNTNVDEATGFFSPGLLIYTVLLGLLPAIYIIIAKPAKPQKPLPIIGIMILSVTILTGMNYKSVPWIHLHSDALGAYVMPWSYIVNIGRYYKHRHDNNIEPIRLPDASIKDSTKAVVVLVIGESARSENFSLYGYGRNTNPLLAKVPGLRHFNAKSAHTYTIAGVRSILSHEPTKKPHECLPNYLYRTGAEVIWRTTNTGEPKLTIEKFKDAGTLKAEYPEADSDYDEILIQGLCQEIVSSGKDKTLLVLHTSTSHGPDYFRKYPDWAETFKPVCKSVELEKCPKEQLFNAYDNTIVYTDYLLNGIIEQLKELKGYRVSMIYISDHGESLGEKSVYMHAMDRKFAPKEQFDIPFIVWLSDDSLKLKDSPMLSQQHIFHSVLRFLSIDSPVYNKELDIFE